MHPLTVCCLFLTLACTVCACAPPGVRSSPAFRGGAAIIVDAPGARDPTGQSRAVADRVAAAAAARHFLELYTAAYAHRLSARETKLLARTSSSSVSEALLEQPPSEHRCCGRIVSVALHRTRGGDYVARALLAFASSPTEPVRLAIIRYPDSGWRVAIFEPGAAP